MWPKMNPYRVHFRLPICSNQDVKVSTAGGSCERSYLRNGEVSGVLNVARLLIQLREGGVHAFVLAPALVVLLWGRLLRGGASL